MDRLVLAIQHRDTRLYVVNKSGDFADYVVCFTSEVAALEFQRHFGMERETELVARSLEELAFDGYFLDYTARPKAAGGHTSNGR